MRLPCHGYHGYQYHDYDIVTMVTNTMVTNTIVTTVIRGLNRGEIGSHGRCKERLYDYLFLSTAYSSQHIYIT